MKGDKNFVKVIKYIKKTKGNKRSKKFNRRFRMVENLSQKQLENK